MDVREHAIADLKIIRSRYFDDERGYFSETFKAHVFAAAGLPSSFVQDNQSHVTGAGNAARHALADST